MSRVVNVNLEARAYAIHIGTGCLAALPDLLPAASAALVVTDTNVEAHYGPGVVRGLEQAGWAVARCVVPAGEGSKTLDGAQTIYRAALEAGLDRRSVIVALGGGMVGDLAGFAAATFLRGVRLVQVPTSLLAMVDSSVGGKTAVNLPQGKNLVGVFYQPAVVVADLRTLDTLPEREYVSGLAEVVKYGVIWDADLFALLETRAADVLAREPALLQEVIGRCCEIKAEIVAVDERESGVRAILNFGHTLGHAVETVAGYGHWLHGEAVALGMAYAARVSIRERGFPERDAERVLALLRRLGLPVELEGPAGKLSWDRVRRAMAADKKAHRSRPTFVLAEHMGSVVFGCDVSEDGLRETFDTVRAT
jgi:3-dehydroquinate synthase